MTEPFLTGNVEPSPPYSLLFIADDSAAKEEADAMMHALFALWRMGHFQTGKKTAWSMRDSKGNRILTASVDADRVCRHIVGYANRQPLDFELQAITELFAARNIPVQYNPATPY